MIKSLKLELDYSRRIIVTSDIHANLGLFKKLLEKVRYPKDDYLFINGDLCEKGPDSLEVLEYVRNLMRKEDHVFLTKGNCDVVFRYVLNGDEGILPYIKKQKFSVLNEMLNRHGKSIEDFTSLQELADFYRNYYLDELEWLESLPIAFETQNHIIIHGGIENRENWYETEESYALYVKAFHERGHQSEKTFIVGHWPAVNYRPTLASSHNPLIDLENRIISIDGGNQIKRDGQLNALIIEGDSYQTTYVDELNRDVIIQKEHIDTTNRVGTVTYPNYEMRIIDTEDYFTLCENRKLGIKQWIKNEYLIENEGILYCKDDLSATFLSVEYGERVTIVDDSCEGYILVKKENGIVGWVPEECLDE